MLAFPEFLEEKTSSGPSGTFIYYGDKRISLAEVQRYAYKISRKFLSLGIGKGDHVALMIPNCPEYIYLWFGLAGIGAVTVAVNNQLKGDSLAYVLTQSDSKLLVAAAEFLPSLSQVTGQIEKLAKITIAAGDPSQPGGLDEWLGDAPCARPEIEVKGSDPFILTYTSGTTGLPKGVLNCFNAYLAGGADLARVAGLGKSDVIYTFLPLYHANPQIYCVMSALSAGSAIALGERFSASRFWDEVNRYRATAFSYVGSVLAILLKQPRTCGEERHWAVKCFGGGAPKEIHEQFTRRFKVQVLELYGMSETGGWNMINRPGDIKFGSVGKVRDGFDVRIFDDDDNEAPAGQPGEIVLRPAKPFIMFSQYYKRHEETLDSFRNLWFHSGDLGLRDEAGYYYFLGRKKENIRRGGENITPYDIEKVILEHPAVMEAAAVGVPDEILGEEIKVYVALKAGEKLKPEEIISWCEPRLARFMLPRYIEFIGELPKTSSEKIMRTELKKLGAGRAWDRLS